MADLEGTLKRVPAVKGLGEALQAKSAQAREAARPAAEAVVSRIDKTKSYVGNVKHKVVTIVKDPQFQKLTISTAGGAITFGTVGGAFGSATGIVVGGAAGLVPALLTFGLSIPIGAVMGGCTGLILGSTTGGTAGGAAGFTVYKYRVELVDGYVTVKVKTLDTAQATKTKILMLKDKVRDNTVECYAGAKQYAIEAVDKTKNRASAAAKLTKDKARETAALAKAKATEAVEFATTTRAGVTATAALTSGAACGIAGGAVGAIAGAAVGVVPALLTFGLSIPIGAAVGLCAGATTGTTAGVVGGSAAGFTGFTYRKEIRDSANYLKVKAKDSADKVTQSVKHLVGAGTGGTA